MYMTKKMIIIIFYEDIKHMCTVVPQTGDRLFKDIWSQPPSSLHNNRGDRAPMSTRGCMQACTAQQKWMETHCDILAHSHCTFWLSFMQTHLQVVSELLICLCENDIQTDFNSENDNANKILELTERRYLTLHGRYWLSQGYVLIVSALNMKLSKPFGYSDMTLLHLSHMHTYSITTFS